MAIVDDLPNDFREVVVVDVFSFSLSDEVPNNCNGSFGLLILLLLLVIVLLGLLVVRSVTVMVLHQYRGTFGVFLFHLLMMSGDASRIPGVVSSNRAGTGWSRSNVGLN